MTAPSTALPSPSHIGELPTELILKVLRSITSALTVADWIDVLSFARTAKFAAAALDSDLSTITRAHHIVSKTGQHAKCVLSITPSLSWRPLITFQAFSGAFSSRCIHAVGQLRTTTWRHEDGRDESLRFESRRLPGAPLDGPGCEPAFCLMIESRTTVFQFDVDEQLVRLIALSGVVPEDTSSRAAVHSLYDDAAGAYAGEVEDIEARFASQQAQNAARKAKNAARKARKRERAQKLASQQAQNAARKAKNRRKGMQKLKGTEATDIEPRSRTGGVTGDEPVWERRLEG